MLTPVSRKSPSRWRRTFFILCPILGTLTVFYIKAKDPRDLNAFDRGVLEVSAPIQRILTSGYGTLIELWSRYADLLGVEEQNRQLKLQVKLLERRLNQARETDLENDRLRKMLRFSREIRLPFRIARVIGYDPTSHFRTIRLDRGEKVGVFRGMAVTTAEGAVGKVLRASANYSDVLLITDARSGVDALIQRTRARGTLEGMGDALLKMKYLLRLDDVEEGDLVVTSGLDGIFPAGILVGTVSGLSKRSTGVFQDVQVVPSVDLSRLSEVLILDTMTLPESETTLPAASSKDAQ